MCGTDPFMTQISNQNRLDDQTEIINKFFEQKNSANGLSFNKSIVILKYEINGQTGSSYEHLQYRDQEHYVHNTFDKLSSVQCDQFDYYNEHKNQRDTYFDDRKSQDGLNNVIQWFGHSLINSLILLIIMILQMQNEYELQEQYIVSGFNTQQAEQCRDNDNYGSIQRLSYNYQQSQQYPYADSDQEGDESQNQYNQGIQSRMELPFAKKINSLASQMKQLVRSAQLDLARKNKANTERNTRMQQQQQKKTKLYENRGQYIRKSNNAGQYFEQGQRYQNYQESQKWRKLYYQQMEKTNRLIQDNNYLNQELFSHQQELQFLQLKFNQKVNQIKKSCNDQQYYALRDAFEKKSKQSEEYHKKYENLKRRVQTMERQYKVKEDRIRTRELQYIAKEKALDEREEEITREWTAVQNARQQNILKETSISKKELDIQRHLQWINDKQKQLKAIMSHNQAKNNHLSTEFETRKGVKSFENQIKMPHNLARRSNVDQIFHSNNLGRENQQQEFIRSKSNQSANKQSKRLQLKTVFQKNYDSTKRLNIQSPSNSSKVIANPNHFKKHSNNKLHIPISSPTKLVSLTDYTYKAPSANFIGQKINTYRMQTNRQGIILGTQNNNGNLANIESKLEKLRRQIRKQISAMD